MVSCRLCSQMRVTSSRSLGAAQRTSQSTSSHLYTLLNSVRSYSSSSQSSSSSSRQRVALLGAGTSLAGLLGASYFLLSSSEKEKLTPYKFTPIKITSVTKLTPETSLFKLALPKDMLDKDQMTSANAIQSIYIMQPDLQIQRPYTPLGSGCFDPKSPSTEIELVVKRYPDGEISRYLHRLGPGDEIRARGPITTWTYGSNAFDEITFIVGGTGVTTALQYLDSMFRTGSQAANQHKSRVNVIFASPTPSRILLESTLNAFAQHDNVTVTYLVDALDNSTSPAPSGVSVGRLDTTRLTQLLGDATEKQTRRKVVVCGPEPMINAVAGPRARDLTQGPVGGMLKQLGYSDHEVVKL